MGEVGVNRKCHIATSLITTAKQTRGSQAEVMTLVTSASKEANQTRP